MPSKRAPTLQECRTSQWLEDLVEHYATNVLPQDTIFGNSTAFLNCELEKSFLKLYNHRFHSKVRITKEAIPRHAARLQTSRDLLRFHRPFDSNRLYFSPIFGLFDKETTRFTFNFTEFHGKTADKDMRLFIMNLKLWNPIHLEVQHLRLNIDCNADQQRPWAINNGLNFLLAGFKKLKTVTIAFKMSDDLPVWLGGVLARVYQKMDGELSRLRQTDEESARKYAEYSVPEFKVTLNGVEWPVKYRELDQRDSVMFKAASGQRGGIWESIKFADIDA